MRSPVVALAFALLLVTAGLSAVAGSPATGAVATQDGNGTGPAPGTRLGGTVGVERASVDGQVAVARLDVRLDDAGSDGERAVVLDDTLTESAARLDALEGDADAVGSGESTPAGAATVAAHATALDTLLGRVETAAFDLPAEDRERYDLLARAAALRERATALRERYAAQAAAIDGEGVGRTTANRADVVDAYENALADGPDVVRRLFGDERIVVRVEEGDGTTNVYSLRTQNGRVVESTDGALADPTVRVTVEGAVIQHLARTDDPAVVFGTARDRGALTYEGVGLGNQVKFGAASVAEGLGDVVGR